MKFDLLPDDCKALLATRPERLGSNAAEQMAKAVAEGREEKVKSAIARLINEDAFTQTQAVAATKEEKPQKTGVQSFVVKRGTRKVCQISSRKGVVGIAFTSSDTNEADDWAKRIRDFIEAELDK